MIMIPSVLIDPLAALIHARALLLLQCCCIRCHANCTCAHTGARKTCMAVVVVLDIAAAMLTVPVLMLVLT
jgi:hypothetical protein